MPISDITKRRSYQANWVAQKRRDNPETYKRLKSAVHERNVEYVIKQKQGKPCTDCGDTFPHFVMQFDHTGDDKLGAVALLAHTNYSIQAIQAEIDKCELVCANCHAIRTYSRSHLTTIK